MEVGQLTRQTESESTLIREELATKDNGRTTNSTETVLKTGRKEQSMKESTPMVLKTAKANTLMPMDQSMTVHGRKIKSTGMACRYG